MKQILIKNKKIVLDTVPKPTVEKNFILVKLEYSCVSQGTEIASLNETQKALFGKIYEGLISQPEKVKKGISYLKREGLKKTLNKLSEWDSRALGYSCAGKVVAIGEGVDNIDIGDRVACAGSGFANHSEFVRVPKHLFAKVPPDLSLKSASTVTLGSIALQGVRRGNFGLGEFVAVIGLGLIGQFTVQLLSNSGCRVIGIDIDEERCQLARESGAEIVLNSKKNNFKHEVYSFTNGFGVDGVIFAASTTDSKPLADSFQICRKKGRVILVGVVGMSINREDMYAKELDLSISTSYGPGRYDESYELQGIDYPYGYVRWTENRNMNEYIRLLGNRSIKIDKFSEKIYSIFDAEKAYSNLQQMSSNQILTFFKYEQEVHNKSNYIPIINTKKSKKNIFNIAIIGIGNYAQNVHLPNLLKLSEMFNIYGICSRDGLKAKTVAEKFGAKFVTTNSADIFNNSEIDAVIISTRHNLHSKLTIQALQAGKAVFLEKPLATSQKDLDEMMKIIKASDLPFMVGFNRRYSPFAERIKKEIKNRINPLIISYNLNSGFIPLDNWVYTNEGGGRIVGEACHIIDLFNYFTESEIVHCSFEKIKSKTLSVKDSDNVSINIKYKDGSLCNLIYTTVGNHDYPKEMMIIHYDNKTISMNNYLSLTGYGVSLNEKSKIQDKGQLAQLKSFYNLLKGNHFIDYDELKLLTELTFEIQK